MSSSSKNPYLLITMGPTGSGKSSLIKAVCEHLQLPITKNKVLIDDLVVDNPYYRTQVKNFLDKKSHDEIIQLFETGDTELQKTFNQFYFSTRRQTYCYKSSQYYGNILNEEDIQFNKDNEKLTLTTDFTTEQYKRFNCDNTNDIKLKDLINSQANFVLETTGTSFPTWLVNIKKLKNYQIIFAIPGVNTCKLLTRNKTRAITTLKNFLNDRDNTEPPRLPVVDEEIYKTNVKKIIFTFNTMITQNNKEYRLLIFNNDIDNQPMTLVYDNNSSKSNNSIKSNILENNFDTQTPCVKGGKKKKIKKLSS